MYRSNVRFLGFLNVCSQLSFFSASVSVETTMYGCRSIRFFRPANRNDKNEMLTTFRSAACSFMLLINAFCLGRSSVGVPSNSCTDIECFALTATTNMSRHFSHSVLGGDSAVSQTADSPAKANGLLEVAIRSSPYWLAAPC